MKLAFRFLALLLFLCLLTGSFTSCMAFVRFANSVDELSSDTETESESESDDDSDLKEPSNTEYPHLTYTLTEADREEFDALLAHCEELTMEGTNISEIEQAWDDLEAQYDHIYTQSNIAYILYCCDQEDETLSENYLASSQMQTEVYDSYIALCQQIDKSTSPYRDTFFEDWTEAEIAEMRAYTSEIADLMQKDDEFLVKFRELVVETDEDAVELLYFDFVKNKNQIAESLGYDDYYSYASEFGYLRDYGAAERATLRQYVKSELVPLCEKAYEMFEKTLSQMNEFQQYRVYDYLLTNYDELSKDYVQLYIDSFDAEAKEAMQKLFEDGNALFVDGWDAYDGAFTVYLQEYEMPVCYFGPSYQDIFTVVHEMGHYYAAQYLPDDELQLDLAEVHSQGNEWLMMAFMETQLSEPVYTALTYYQLYYSLANIIVCTIVDEFEEMVYMTVDSNMSIPLDFDDLIDTICTQYGDSDFVETYITDMNLYWKYVGIEAPVYYISYATSGVASLALFSEAKEDYAAAQEIYRKLVEDADCTRGFAENLKDAGLPSPFEASAYTAIRELLP